ncbi:MAG: adenylate/guanylate cyclase domain-containing protein, partial [Hyphomicrobiales bacterium]|nr:adenylate/guanylate cyclase domain-containing protein [Hyphomicrobiales bacterium]
MERRLAAILAADIVGYSGLMEFDETRTLERQNNLRVQVLDPTIQEHHGRVFKLMGDGLLAEFPSVIDAVNCAVEMQRKLGDSETDIPDEDRIKYRIGINSGDVIIDGDDIHGDGVNVASRLEQLAHPGGICIAGAAHDQMRTKVDFGFELIGDVQVKNIDRPIQAFRVLADPKNAGKVARSARPAKKPFHNKAVTTAILAIVILLVVGTWIWVQRSELFGFKTETIADAKPSFASVAVLPLDDLSIGDKKGYLSDALSEGIITELARFSQFKVIARNSSFQFRESPTDIREIGKTLDVDYVIEGSQQYDGEQVRVTVQLIETASGNHVYVEKLDSKIKDLFKLQDEIVGHVASKIGGTILSHVPTKRSANEVDSLLRGLQSRKILRIFSRENWEKALALERTSVR